MCECSRHHRGPASCCQASCRAPQEERVLGSTAPWEAGPASHPQGWLGLTQTLPRRSPPPPPGSAEPEEPCPTPSTPTSSQRQAPGRAPSKPEAGVPHTRRVQGLRVHTQNPPLSGDPFLSDGAQAPQPGGEVTPDIPRSPGPHGAHPPPGGWVPLIPQVAESRAARPGPAGKHRPHASAASAQPPTRNTRDREQPTVAGVGGWACSTLFPPARLLAGNSPRGQAPPGWARS